MRLKDKIKGALDWLQSTSNTFKYVIFLLSLQYLFAAPFFWRETQPLPGSIIREGRLMEYLWAYSDLIFTLLGGIFAVSRKTRTLVIASLIGVIAIATTLASDILQTKEMYLASDIAGIAFFLYTALAIFHDLWTARSVTIDTIVGSVCVYMLIGTTWSFFYTLVELLFPGSFIITPSGRAVDQALLSARYFPLFVYYSFTILTSVGFGDIIPVKPLARFLSTWEGMCGQFYMAILVAILVAIHIPHTAVAVKNDTPPDPQSKS